MNFSGDANDRFLGAIINDKNFLLNNVCEWINENTHPWEVFDDEVLNDWAEENGYVKKEKDDE